MTETQAHIHAIYRYPVKGLSPQPLSRAELSAGKTLAWVGDGNNVCASFIHAAPKLGFKLKIASPAIYHPDLVDLARAAEQQGQVWTTEDPREAVRGADVVITDTWVSMGDTDHDEHTQAGSHDPTDEAHRCALQEELGGDL